MKAFLAPEDATASPYPPLLFCWKLCIDIIDTLYNLVNPSDGQPTALYFQHPVSCYCGGKFPQGYLDKIAKPMDFGTVTSNLLEGRYQSVEDFSVDCRLVISNCNTYYQDQEGGSVYIEQANRLNEYLARQLDQLARYAKSSKGASDRTRSLQTPSLPRPPAEVLLSIVEEMKSIKYTDKATKITEAAMGPFEKPVSLAAFPDYPIHVKEPVDLQAIERKVGSDQYSTVEDFEYDFYLMFRNCEVYNAQRGGDHLVSMAKHGAKQFRKIFYSKIRGFEDPSSFSPPKPETALASSKDEVQPPLKKIKINPIGASKGKTAPRLSIPASHSNLGADERPVAKSPKTVATGTQKKAGATIMTPKPSQPVPLHIAIARVKEAFPLRRAVKSLQLWEADCARYFKELMRHPWISAARPKFIFHVPVPDLFPELKDAYAQKIRKPMDLTTVECTLLAGNRYATPEDFIQDIALVFANAVRFNKDGRDIGDPLSCAYYDASVHLLRYSRWLSLELLQAHIDETSEYVDDVGPDGLPPSSWKLTAGNRRKARDEMEALVMKEPIEKSLEGDRYTWMETECEKLLKALRHQSVSDGLNFFIFFLSFFNCFLIKQDLRHMTFFIQPNYPADYTAFIARPMDWEKVQRTLKKRQYDCFNDIVSDLRLIFSNALKYNARLKGTDTVSGRAYESARYMSNKLEIAINKMVLAVSDRLERERIDHANAEREIEAAERAEEAIIRAAWKKERGQDGSSPTPPQGDIAQKNRLVRRAAQRREAADFEMPFFDDEDNGQHESSYFEVVKLQKSIYEKQTQELQKMRQVANKLGGNMLVKIFQRHRALEWVANEAKVTLSNMRHVVAIPSGEPDIPRDKQLTSSGSVALVELQNEGRARIQVKLNWAGPKRKARIKQQRSDLDACAFD